RFASIMVNIGFPIGHYFLFNFFVALHLDFWGQQAQHIQSRLKWFKKRHEIVQRVGNWKVSAGVLIAVITVMYAVWFDPVEFPQDQYIICVHYTSHQIRFVIPSVLIATAFLFMVITDRLLQACDLFLSIASIIYCF